MATIQDDRPVRFLSVLEAAKLLRVSPRTVYGWVSQRLGVRGSDTTPESWAPAYLPGI